MSPRVGVRPSRQRVGHPLGIRLTLELLVAQTDQMLGPRVGRRRYRVDNLLILTGLEPLLDLRRRLGGGGLRNEDKSNGRDTHD